MVEQREFLDTWFGKIVAVVGGVVVFLLLVGVPIAFAFSYALWAGVAATVVVGGMFVFGLLLDIGVLEDVYGRTRR